ncbi:MAG: hypothetical protein F9K24_20330 [Leptonema illini]|jgi:hypothetical protein|uniref:Uncharacterized protein n=1 Tax=Leptonema illini TaxID=183 RepID=A0A833LZD7_9LEPT|nr:MAG: hypothetical protein F9K24_20330 [Leptonema illini]
MKQTEINVQTSIIKFSPYLLVGMMGVVASGAFYAGSELARINSNLEKVVSYMHRTERVEKIVDSICYYILNDDPSKASVLKCEP